MVGLIVPMLVTVLIGDDNVLLKNLEYLFNEDVLMQYNGPDNPLFDTTASARYFILICVCWLMLPGFFSQCLLPYSK